MLKIGQIVCPHGVGGEVKVMPSTDSPQRFLELKQVTVCRDLRQQVITITGARIHQHFVLLKLEGVDDRNQAEALRNWAVKVPVEEAVPLPPGRYYDYQLVGLEVIDLNSNCSLGAVAEVLHLPANAVYRVTDAAGTDRYVPALKSVVTKIDLTGRKMYIVPPKGLLE